MWEGRRVVVANIVHMGRTDIFNCLQHLLLAFSATCKTKTAVPMCIARKPYVLHKNSQNFQKVANNLKSITEKLKALKDKAETLWFNLFSQHNGYKMCCSLSLSCCMNEQQTCLHMFWRVSRLADPVKQVKPSNSNQCHIFWVFSNQRAFDKGFCFCTVNVWPVWVKKLGMQ